MLRKLGISLGVLVVIGLAAAFFYRDYIARLSSVLTLFDEENIVENFSKMEQLFYST